MLSLFYFIILRIKKYKFNIFRPTNDDVDVLKRELISVQQRMNDMSLEKEEEIEKLRSIIKEMYVNRLFFSSET